MANDDNPAYGSRLVSKDEEDQVLVTFFHSHNITSPNNIDGVTRQTRFLPPSVVANCLNLYGLQKSAFNKLCQLFLKETNLA